LKEQIEGYLLASWTPAAAKEKFGQIILSKVAHLVELAKSTEASSRYFLRVQCTVGASSRPQTIELNLAGVTRFSRVPIWDSFVLIADLMSYQH
jgi:hypothetical protein